MALVVWLTFLMRGLILLDKFELSQGKCTTCDTEGTLLVSDHRTLCPHCGSETCDIEQATMVMNMTREETPTLMLTESGQIMGTAVLRSKLDDGGRTVPQELSRWMSLEDGDSEDGWNYVYSEYVIPAELIKDYWDLDGKHLVIQTADTFTRIKGTVKGLASLMEEYRLAEIEYKIWQELNDEDEEE